MRGMFLAAPLAALVAIPAAAAPPPRLQVVGREFSFALSRQRLRAGPVVIELVNFGEDVHDLRLRRVGGTRVRSIGVVLPGGHAALQTRLPPGRYVLWCSIADHRARGMHAVLGVRR
ncbi:MAG TPA: hypothetical protein VE753_09225 [Gaiellaceae bacterium]|nr:hypothetical protein [Gaiellaceae bacterium]